MSSIRDQILTAIVTALNGAGKPAGVTVRRFSMAKIEPDQQPLVEVYPGKDIAQDAPKGRPVVMRTLAVILDVYAIGDPVDQEIDPVLCWVTEALNADRSLGGLALDLREKSAEWDGEMAAMGQGLCKVIVEVEYHHNRNNQESRT